MEGGRLVLPDKVRRGVRGEVLGMGVDMDGRGVFGISRDRM